MMYRAKLLDKKEAHYATIPDKEIDKEVRLKLVCYIG